MKTLAVLSRKGGTGKTTLALHLAVAARADGHATLLADMDRQQSAVAWRRQSGRTDPRIEAVKPGALFTRQQDAVREGLDLLIVDTGPNVENDVEQAVRCSDLCLIVARPNFFDLKAVAESAELARQLGKPALFVLNQAPSRRAGVEAPVVAQAVRLLREASDVAPVGLRARAAYQHSVAAGLVAQELLPLGPAAREIDGLWRHLEGLLWPASGHAAVWRDPPAFDPASIALRVPG
jgi:chromosome partitioning protein